MESHGRPRGLRGFSDRAAWASLVLALFAASAAAGNPQTLGRDSAVKIFSPDGGEWEVFGRHVALQGDVAVISEPEWGDMLPPGPGAAYVYRYDADEDLWALEAQLDPFGPGDGSNFGDAMEMDGDVIVVGSGDWADEDGAVFIFRFDPETSTWVQEQSVLGETGYSYGDVVAIDGDTIITTADWGTIDVFRYDSDSSAWIKEQQLVPDQDYRYITALDIEGDRIVAGYHGYHDQTGTAVIFEYDADVAEWFQTARLDASDAAKGDRFGGSAILAGNLVAIGAQEVNIGPNEPGTVYIFQSARGVWDEVAMITPNDGGIGDCFGEDVDFDGTTLLVGAWSQNPDGAAYLYDFDPQTYEWTLLEKYLPHGQDPRSFGVTVSMSQSRALIGDFKDSELYYAAGAAYIFEIPDGPCPADVNEDLVVNIDDLFQVLSAWGPCDDCPEDINEDQVVDIDDAFEVLSDWGPC